MWHTVCNVCLRLILTTGDRALCSWSAELTNVLEKKFHVKCFVNNFWCRKICRINESMEMWFFVVNQCASSCLPLTTYILFVVFGCMFAARCGTTKLVNMNGHWRVTQTVYKMCHLTNLANGWVCVTLRQLIVDLVFEKLIKFESI